MKASSQTIVTALASGLIFVSSAALPAQEPTTITDELLPQPVTEGHFNQVLGNSPFLRILDLSETYSLRGIAEIDGQPVATLYNRDKKRTVVVAADEANDLGMKLVDVVPNQDLTGVMARISVGGEEVELKFDSDRVNPQPKGGGRGGTSGGDRKDGKRRGPSKEDIERYKALSDEKKEKLRNFIRGTMQKYPKMSREDRGNLIRGAMQKLSDGRDIEIPEASGTPQGGGGQRPGRDRR